MDGGVGISAAVAIGSKFVERSKFAARHDASYDKEADKSAKLAERFDRIPKEDVDHFEYEAYDQLHSRSLQDLRQYKYVQDEYKSKEWYKQPAAKIHLRTKVRKAKRRVQSSVVEEGSHVQDLERYSRSSSSRCSSVGSIFGGSESGLQLSTASSKLYRTDSCSVRATGGSPPSASLEDIENEERRTKGTMAVLSWLTSLGVIHDSQPDTTYSQAGSTSALRPTNEHLAILLPRVLWKARYYLPISDASIDLVVQPDSVSTACDLCQRVAFSFFQRRHAGHCRKCGGIFCGSCASRITPLLDTSKIFDQLPLGVPISRRDFPDAPVIESRVCDTCWDQIYIPPDASTARNFRTKRFNFAPEDHD
ncbi:hypothetical protein CVT26_002716 [Gymnopilus dilepis]|uniref:FYVE-type domain-containing protein n=1 Tax=Gymnopilus dilepis TaxID=231916 RepID=A0A409Y394_9AGAR|nr:hypothetical protein CVT26_002716 [Gymnopilus dilepis]